MSQKDSQIAGTSPCQMPFPPEDMRMSWTREAAWWPVSALEQPKPE